MTAAPASIRSILNAADIRIGGAFSRNRTAAQRLVRLPSCRAATRNSRKAFRSSVAAGLVPKTSSRPLRRRRRAAGAAATAAGAVAAAACDQGRWRRTATGRLVTSSGSNRRPWPSNRTSRGSAPAATRPLRIPTVVRWMPVRWGNVQLMRSETSYQIVTVVSFRRGRVAGQANGQAAFGGWEKKWPGTSVNPSVMLAG